MSSTEVAKTEVNIAGGLLWPGLPCHQVLWILHRSLSGALWTLLRHQWVIRGL